MINLKEALVQDIEAGLKAAREAKELEFDEKALKVTVERAREGKRGDYASPVALMLGKQLGIPPMDIVEIIAQHMPKKEYVGSLEAAAPGFLNIWIHDEWMMARLDDVLEQDVCADIRVGESKSVNLEFISANPTGPLTLGNARTAFSADTLANVLSCAGFNVTREYYINDAGEQIRRLGESVLRRLLIEKGHQVEFAEDLYQGEYITNIATTIAEEWKENEGKEFAPTDLENQEVLEKVSTRAMELCLAEIKRTVRDDLKIEFDVWTSEKAIRESDIIEKALEKLRQGGFTYEKDGAEHLKTTQFGDSDDRVLVKNNGEYAYIMPDIGYHLNKYERKFDLIFTFLGADHQGHIPKLTAGMKALGLDAAKLHFIVAQWMRIVRGGEAVKLSKRKGNVYGPKDLIEEIGYDAARFFMVQHALTSHMDLDLDVAKDKSEKNPVYYTQYAYVRLQSIIRKAKEQELIEAIGEKVQHVDKLFLTDASELALMRTMYRWPEVVADIARTYEVHQLAYYAYDLAKAIHVFYKNVPVLAATDKQVQDSRIHLVVAAKKVLAEVLDVLGISKPNVM